MIKDNVKNGSTDNDNLRLFALNSSKKLGELVSKKLDVPLSKCEITRFADGEVNINIEESVRNDVVFVVQSTSLPVNESLMELLIFIDALKRASAKQINIVMPYYGYSRQDRKARSRQPISAKLVADMLEVAGANRIIAVELHAAQIQGFFDIPTDHLSTTREIINYIREGSFDLENVVIVSPDHGGVQRARHIAEGLDTPIAIIDKRRPKPNQAEVSHIIGDIENKICIMVDDIVDTAGTLTLGAQALKDKGANEVYAICVHGILSDPATERIQNSVLKKLIITDSIEIPEYKRTGKIEMISIADLLSCAIENVYNGMPISHLFDGR